MPGYLIIIIVVIAALLFYFIVAISCYKIAKRKKPYVSQELEKLASYEIERGKEILEIISRLNKKNYKFDKEATKVIRNGVDNMLTLSPNDRALYKNMADFSALFINKLVKEDVRFKGVLSQEELDKLHSYQEDSDLKYKEYNKKAGVYNSLIHMPFVRLIIKIRHADLEEARMF